MASEFKVLINTIDKAKKFAQTCEHYSCDIDLSHGRYMIDAKSIMGIFAFDLTKVLTVTIHTSDTEEQKRFNEEMRDFKVDD